MNIGKRYAAFHAQPAEQSIDERCAELADISYDARIEYQCHDLAVSALHKSQWCAEHPQEGAATVQYCVNRARANADRIIALRTAGVPLPQRVRSALEHAPAGTRSRDGTRRAIFHAVRLPAD